MARPGKPGGIPSLSKPAQPAASVKPVVQSTKPSSALADDDWQTDPDSVNVASSKKEQRFGHSAGKGSINLNELRQSAVTEHETTQKTRDKANAFSRGYGGKFGLEADRTDASENRSGSPATDTKSKNKQPAKAADAKYESAESYKAGYGGKFGVQSDRFDSSAHRFDDEAVAGAGKTSQHSSVTDSKKGYGGAFGVQKDRQDKSAHGFDERDDSRENEPKPGAKVADAKYGSAQDYKKGYGGEFGVQIDRFDKNAAGFDDKDSGAEPVSGSRPLKPSLPKPTTTGDNRAKNLRSFFENINSVKAEEASKTSAAAVQKRKDFEQSVFDREKKKNEEKKAAEAAQREAEKKAAPAPAKAPEPVVPAYVPPPRPAPVPEPPAPAYVPPPVPAPEPVRLKEPEPEPEPQPAVAAYTYTPPEPQPEPQPEPTPVQQFGALRVEDVEPPQPEEGSSFYANVEVARLSAAEEPAPAAGVPTAYNAETAQQTLFVAEAIFDYEATAEDELAFHAGDRINVIQKVDEGTEGWWLGECGGRTGLFPANYVKTDDQ